ncbi:MAG: HAMP domain-containing protein [Deltaproteobacteria bacterium]|nr:HAMP domain-containing protein [Deltaproteobacteria bacterium]
MFRFFSKSIMARLTFHFFLVGFVPLLIFGATSYYYAKNMLESEVNQIVTSMNDTNKKAVVDFLEERMKSIRLQSKSQNIAVLSDNNFYQIAHSLYKDYMDIFGYTDILMLDQSGIVMFSATINQNDATADVSFLDDPVLEKLAKAVVAKKDIAMTDMTRYKPFHSISIFMGAPILGDDGEPSAILVFVINASQISNLTKKNVETGKTMESYLVGPDFLMRSASRFTDKSVVMSRNVDSIASRLAFEKGAGTTKMTDYRDQKVMCAYSTLGLNNRLGTTFDWAIITKIDQDEAFAFLHNLRRNIILTLFLLLVLVFGAGYIQSNGIAGPLKKLSSHVALMDEGDFSIPWPVGAYTRSDELGLLINSYNRGINRLRKQIRQMKDSANLLVSSISQISATASQLSSSASETSSSISEVTTTMEEVRQTSEISMEKAQNVARSADRTSKISQAGKSSTENTMAGVNRIRKEMNYIAESTVKLSEQTQRIGEIINTVTDIADQSNILSVNAAIEAAKAGEHGKGFAVVAQEVKTLADQSKDATSQVRTILDDIQKATSAAVMATERGTKTVEEAVELSEQSGDAIDRLTADVEESSEAALQITVSTQQQLTGMDQLSQAMESINDATLQNLDSVRQLEEAIKNMEDMGHIMTNFVNAYKI